MNAGSSRKRRNLAEAVACCAGIALPEAAALIRSGKVVFAGKQVGGDCSILQPGAIRAGGLLLREPQSAQGEESVRIQRTVADALGISRRKADDLVAAGRVALNGVRAQLGTKHGAADEIAVDGKVLPRLPAQAVRIIAYRKGSGEITSRNRPRSVFASLPQLAGGRWLAVGRLDVATAGLLLFTNDGDVAHRLAHPSFALEREYEVHALDAIPARVRVAAVRNGMAIDGQVAHLRRFDMRALEGQAGWTCRIIVTEGRNRLVRRIFEHLGIRIKSLVRIRFGGYAMPRSLRPGEAVEIDLAQILASPSSEA